MLQSLKRDIILWEFCHRDGDYMIIIGILGFIIGLIGFIWKLQEKMWQTAKLNDFVKNYPEQKGLENLDRLTILTIFGNGDCKTKATILTTNLSNQPIANLNYEIWGGNPVKNCEEIKFVAQDWRGKLKTVCTQNSETFKRFEIKLRKPLKPRAIYKYSCSWKWPKTFEKIFEKEWYESKIPRPTLKQKIIIKFPKNTVLSFFKEYDFATGAENEINVIKKKSENSPVVEYAWAPHLGRIYRFVFAVSKRY